MFTHLKLIASDPLREECWPGIQDSNGGQGGQLRRQEMPLHWPRPDPRQNPQRSRPEAQDAAHRRH